MDLALLLVRAVVGVILAAHGSQKLFGWFHGGGIRGTAEFFRPLGFRPAALFVVGAGFAELVGGLGLAVGLLTPLAAALLVGDMLVATLTFHRGKGLFTENGGCELPLIIIAASVAVALMGPGKASVDHAIHFAMAGTRAGALAVGLGLLGALGAMGARALGQKREVSA